MINEKVKHFFIEKNLGDRLTMVPVFEMRISGTIVVPGRKN